MWESWIELYPTIPDAFWQQTPRTYMMHINAALKRREYERDLGVTVAWLSGIMSQTTKPPTLEQLLADTRPKRPKAVENVSEEQKNAFLLAALRGFSSTLPKERPE